MTVTIGVIGVGMIGQDHIRRLTHVLAGRAGRRRLRRRPGAHEGGGRAPCRCPRGCTPPARSSSPTPTCRPSSSRPGGRPTRSTCSPASGPGKPVFCEKPLATTEEACSRIIDAEVEAGRRLVQVGFMRRYDAAYRAMKQVVDSGDIGSPLLVHSRHRNPSVPEHYTREMAITDTAVHDFDTVRWLLGEELVVGHRADAAAQQARRRPAGPADDAVRDGVGCARRRGDVGEHPLRLRHPRRGRRGGRDGGAGRLVAGAGPAGRHGVRAGSPRTGASGSSAPTTWSCRSGWTRSPPAGGRPDPAPGTGTPRPWCPTPRSRRCAPAPRWPVALRDKPDLYAKEG